MISAFGIDHGPVSKADDEHPIRRGAKWGAVYGAGGGLGMTAHAVARDADKGDYPGGRMKILREAADGTKKVRYLSRGKTAAAVGTGGAIMAGMGAGLGAGVGTGIGAGAAGARKFHRRNR